MAFCNNTRFYEDSLTKHGNSAKGVHWNSQETQYKRFAVLTGFLSDLQNSSIVDAGCGCGHYLNYLHQYETLPDHYLGLDCEVGMIELAQQEHPIFDFALTNILEDSLPVADYYICSGAMNILSVAEMYKFIKRCFEHSQKGFAFNFLSAMSYNNATVDDVIGYCQSLTPSIQTKGGYLVNDFSIFMKKI